jgi:hypothetical protein
MSLNRDDLIARDRRIPITDWRSAVAAWISHVERVQARARFLFQICPRSLWKKRDDRMFGLFFEKIKKCASDSSCYYEEGATYE